MEKMNQVSVSEFFAKSKEEMYDMAVEMVEKYNRLVDICNDSAERMAEFMAKDDINEFKKELQSKAPGEFKIQKLADIVVWADGIIRDGGYYEEKYNSDGATAYCFVKAHELWKIKEVVLEAINRHKTYTNALNNDIADKAAKIDLLEKELEGRKEGYKKNMSDSLYNEIARRLTEKINELTIKVANQKKNLDGINKTLEIRNKENESLIQVRNNQTREIEAHEAENKRLTERIKSLKTELANERNAHILTRDREEVYKEKILEKNNTIDKLREEQNQYKEFIDGLKKDLNYWKEAFETQSTSLADVRKLNDELSDTLNKSSDEVEKLEKQVKYLKKELDQTCTCKELDLKGHQSRETALVNALADKDEEIKELKEEIEELKKKNFDDFKRRDTDIINQAKRIRELEEENSCLKKECKNKNDIIRKAYTRYMDEACKNREEIMDECYKKLTKDDTGYTGFKQYTLRALEAEKGNEEKAKEFIDRAASIIFYNKKAEEERKEEEAKKYRPSEIDELTDLLKEEVDKKRIVDVGEGVETELGVSRELLDAAIKLMVANGYHEYYGRIPQATDETKYGLVHVLTIPGVDIEDIAKRENIKSLDFDIPCGSDSIE